MQELKESCFNLIGEQQQMVEIALNPGESVMARSGTLVYMEQGIVHEVVDNRIVASDKWQYTNRDGITRKLVFCAPNTGRIAEIDLEPYEEGIVCRTDAFLCSAKGNSIEIEFEKLYGSNYMKEASLVFEGLIGDGTFFIYSPGTIIKKHLLPGEVLRVDSRCILAMSKDIQYSIQKIIEKIEDKDHDLYFMTVSGPGDMWLQTTPSDGVLK